MNSQTRDSNTNLPPVDPLGTKVKLWKFNRLDEEYTLTQREIIDGFLDSEYATRRHWTLDRRLRAYIAFDLESVLDWESDEGLKEYQILLTFAVSAYREHRDIE